MSSTPEALDSPAGKYPGEDARPTSAREVAGWYSYGWAAEVFIVCGIGSFLPITLEQLARERGVLLSDGVSPCTTGLNVPPLPAPNGTTTALTMAPSDAHQCVVDLFGMHINTASFAMYTFSLSVLVQTLLIISISGAADHGTYRKSLLLSFAFVGAIATMLFLPVGSNLYVLAAVLAVIANTCVGASFVLLNSFLPLLVRHHPSLAPAAGRHGAQDLVHEHDSANEDEHADDDFPISTQDSLDSSRGLLSGESRPDATRPSKTAAPSPASPQLQLATKISSNGIGIGYIAAVIVQTISTVTVVLLHGSTFSLRLVLFIIGAWWLVFSIPAALWLRPRPGPPLTTAAKTEHTTWSYLIFSWRSLYKTLLKARRLRDILLFLAAWLLLSDGIATVSGTAVLYAKTTLNMQPAALALINIVVMVAGILGAFTWALAARRLRLSPSQTILACLLLFELIPLYALLSYIPAIQRLGYLGLQQPWEMYVLGAVYGLVMGGLSSHCRALYGELVPPGFEAAFFALYAVTDKGSSVFGPAVVGAIVDAFKEIRPAFIFLAVLIGLPLPLIWCVDAERGKREAKTLAAVLEVEAGVEHAEHVS